MVIEKVKEIKKAEEKAETILKDAEKKAESIKNSLEERLQRLKKEKERFLDDEIKKYRGISEEKTKQTMMSLSEENRRQKEEITQKYQNKIALTVDDIWKEIVKDIFMR